MTGYIYNTAGERAPLPELTGWEVTHTADGGCDAFAVMCRYDPGMAETLRAACRFKAFEGADTVFTGVVDEWEARADGAGLTLTVRGRGLAALLLDNEAAPARYYGATLDFILERHAAPWGVTQVQKKAMSAAGEFAVESGDSQWKVLRSFCRFCGGVEPRFDRRGVLLLDGSEGEKRAFIAQTAITEQAWTEERYGVISEVLVRTAAGAETTVENGDFKARGGLARRVVNVPRRTGYDAMRYTGSYQIAQSAKEAELCTVTLPVPFAAFAGDRVAMYASPLGITGDFTVLESRCRAGDGGAETSLKLRRC